MQIEVKAPEVVRGRVELPSSKSISNRVLVINALSGNGQMPNNVSDCDDTNVMIKWLTDRHSDTESGVPVIDIGAAGTAMRFSSALLAVSEGAFVITGTERMKNRPISILVNALRELGAEVAYVEKEGFPPLRITGNPHIKGGEISLPGSVSSQYISALLMIAPIMEEGLRLVLTGDIISRPYIDMTLGLMRAYGATAEWESDQRSIVVKHGRYEAMPYLVENDWSAASYWYEIVAFSRNEDVQIVLPGLFAKSMQGDSHGAEVFAMLGVDTRFEDDGTVVLSRSGERVGFLEYNFLQMPDLAQTFVVTCCMLGVPFHFTGLQSLKIKETDRIEALKTELAKLGFIIESRNDSELMWNGTCQAIATEQLAEVAIDTYEDHRMAMAFAPAALRLGSIRVNNPEVVSKSYPRYWSDLRSVGFQIHTAL
ncbi:MAG: 3-phosphoshikimate 1-carboxyvinyltransferase [Prevotellaceae bacterium]|nr:3-phosphoshikimate 1-carboxyvinyltransferase [Prevotellaceae bacterium]